MTTSAYRIGGRQLAASPVFDTYWRFAAARQAVYEARLAGEPGPWSKDPVLGSFRFTNVYRASDRVSQFLIKDVIYDRERSVEDLVFRTLFFKFFNRISTWKHVEQAVGDIAWQCFDPTTYAQVLDELSASGPIYSPAYVIPPPKLGAVRKHHNHLRLLELMMEDGFAGRVRQAGGLDEIYADLLGFPSIGKFLAFQFTIDLNYGPLTDLDEDEFVVAGPGAVDGIRKCFGQDSTGRESEIIRYVVDSQDEHFGRLGLDFDGLFGRRLHLIDAQNLFCEVDKYARVVHPEAQGRSGRSRIKQRFQPVLDQLTAVFPPKWGLTRRETEAPLFQVDRHDALVAPA